MTQLPLQLEVKETLELAKAMELELELARASEEKAIAEILKDETT